MSDAVSKHANGMVRKLAHFFPDLDKDLMQEAEIALLESQSLEAVERKRFVTKRLNQAVKRLKPIGGEMFSGVYEYVPIKDANPVIKRRRGAESSPKTKQDKYRHNKMKNGCCARCGKTLAERGWTLCLLCRAWHAYRRWRRKHPHYGKSSYSEVWEIMGWTPKTCEGRRGKEVDEWEMLQIMNDTA